MDAFLKQILEKLDGYKGGHTQSGVLLSNAEAQHLSQFIKKQANK